MSETDDVLTEEPTESFGPDEDHSTTSSDLFSSHNYSYEISDSSAETD